MMYRTLITGGVVVLLLALAAWQYEAGQRLQVEVEYARFEASTAQAATRRLVSEKYAMLSSLHDARQLAEQRQRVEVQVQERVVTREKVVRDAVDPTDCFDACLPDDVLRMYPDAKCPRAGGRLEVPTG